MFVQGIAEAFAIAGAKAIIVTARKADTLKDTEAAIKKANSSTEVLRVGLEVTDEAAVANAFETIAKSYPTIDVLVNNAGSYISDKQPLVSADTSKWWADFDINVKGTMFVTRSFLSQVKADAKASVIFLTSGAGFIALPGESAYSLTKLIDMRFAAFVAVENPNVRSVAIHPGIVATDMANANAMFAPYAHDKKELSAGLINWSTSDEAAFMNGRYMSANWDVAELIERKDEIVKKDLLTMGVNGSSVGTVAELKG